MLYLLAEKLAVHYSGFNVFSYLTLRTILAVASSLLISLGLRAEPEADDKPRRGGGIGDAERVGPRT